MQCTMRMNKKPTTAKNCWQIYLGGVRPRLSDDGGDNNYRQLAAPSLHPWPPTPLPLGLGAAAWLLSTVV